MSAHTHTLTIPAASRPTIGGAVSFIGRCSCGLWSEWGDRHHGALRQVDEIRRAHERHKAEAWAESEQQAVTAHEKAWDEARR